MESRTVRSTSRSSAKTDDIELRVTSLTRLVFRPLLIDNARDPAASVKGTFIFQKKAKNDEWEDILSPPLSHLKIGDDVRLPLSSEELFKLHSELSSLYQLVAVEGIPKGRAEYVKADAVFRQLADMSNEELRSVIGGRKKLGAAALARLIRWAASADNFSLLFDRLAELGEDDLLKLNAALGIAGIKRALKQWTENRQKKDEDFWHDLLAKQSFALEQIFHVPIVIIKSKAYMGGKSVLNTGGKIVDFLVKNRVTSSVALVEIKTPATPLLGEEYRTGVYNVSKDLSGAVQQVLCYREALSREQSDLLNPEVVDADVFDPLCVVLIGSAKRELDDKDKKQAFELFRRQLSDVTVVTYDEMYGRMQRLVNVLQGVTEPDIEGPGKPGSQDAPSSE